MTSRSERIAQVVERRKPLADRVAKSMATLSIVKDNLTSLRGAMESIKSAVNDETSNRITALGRKIDQLSVEIADRQAELTRLKNRFSRPTLNIGVVGRAGNGKSRLLQSLTGLSSREIPDGSGGHCTGAQSVIVHDEQAAHAEVYFHSESAFLSNVLAPYYAKLGLGPAPRTTSEFANTALPPLPAVTIESIARTKYDYLKKYQDHFNDYGNWFREPNPKNIGHDEIRNFVAQDTPDKTRSQFSFMAVDFVKIFCKFPMQDVKGISVIDMPGLGDTGIGHVERLIESLAEEIDWVLFVKMPLAARAILEDVDHQLYETAAAALCDALPIQKWSTMVINQTGASSPQGDNSKNCELVIDELRRSPIKVTNVVLVDCSKTDEVNQRLLDPVVDYLAKNIEQLDKEYASHCEDKLKTLSSELANITKEAKSCMATGHGATDEFQVFSTLFKAAHEKLNVELQRLLTKRRGFREQPDECFQAKVRDILDQASKATLPTIEDIEHRKAQNPGTYNGAYEHFLNLKRTDLSRRFLQIDDSLDDAFREVQVEVGQAIRKQMNLPTSIFSGDDHEVIREVRDYLKEKVSNLTDLIEGFDLLADFKLDYRGMIQHRIRKHLDKLDPESAKRHKLDPDNPDAEEVQQTIEIAYKEAISEIRYGLKQMEAEPSQAIFAFIEEFVDRVCRAENIEQQWSAFIYQIRADVWPRQFNQLADNSRLQKSVNTAIDQLNESYSNVLFL
jgi:energy-coupling factor transporter ATP-binding protein EcfA2